MPDMKPKDEIKLDIVELDKSETYAEEEVLPEGDLCRYLIQPCEQDRYQEIQATYFIWNKVCSCKDLSEKRTLSQVIEESISCDLYYSQDVILGWVNESKGQCFEM